MKESLQNLRGSLYHPFSQGNKTYSTHSNATSNHEDRPDHTKST